MRAPRNRPTGRSGDGHQSGTATIEFVLVALLLMVPLAYVLLSALHVQRTAFGVVEAARAAARAFITAPTADSGRRRAEQAVAIALGDQGVSAADSQLIIGCSTTPCLTPGGSVRVEVDSTVRLVGVLGTGATIPVRAVHVETVDPFEPGRP